jgi:DNA repair exonuclease SbcCD ATPase subunit
MKHIILKSAHAENFKVFKDITLSFGKESSVYAKNYTGKSSIADMVSWVLFGKSSTGNVEGKHFHPRRYDKNGVNIDHVDVVAEIVLSIDGEETTIRKVQKQKWVRHTGDSEKTYEGDKTEFFWDGVPTTATEHKKKVAGIMDESVFYMLINPATFPAMPWKKQREYLTEHIANITDSDVLNLPEYAALKEKVGKKSLEEFRKVTKEAIKGYKKKQAEIPIRIDQEQSSIQEVDFSKEEIRLAELEKEISDTETAIENTASMYEEKNRISTEIADIKGNMISLEAEEKDRIGKARADIQSRIYTAGYSFNDVRNKLKDIERDNEERQRKIDASEKYIDEIREKYNMAAKQKFDENELICPACGQSYPEEKQEELRQSFSESQRKTLKGFIEDGNEYKKITEEMRAAIDATAVEIKTLKERMVSYNGEKTKLMQELEEIKDVVPENIEGWTELRNEYNRLNEELQKIDVSDADRMRAELKEKKNGIQSEIDGVKERLALKTVMEKKRQAVENLAGELVEVTHRLMEAENLDMEIEKCIRAKMDMLSEKINSMFKVIKWKLFDQLKNGGWEECCVCQINGSDYGDNTTSTTERMMAGMDIINTLQELNEIKAPIFLDDADLYNDYNIPEMDCQIIKLCVSNDDELKVEVE